VPRQEHACAVGQTIHIHATFSCAVRRELERRLYMSTRVFPLITLATLSFALTACSTTGATFRSGVGDAFPDRAPYYAGARTTFAADTGARIGVLPVHYQPGVGAARLYDPGWGPNSAISDLIKEMNGFLDSLTTGTGKPAIRLVTGLARDRTLPSDLKLGVAPDVRFGCLTELELPGDDCAARGDSVLGRGRQIMKLAVGRPDPVWTRWVGTTMDAARTTHTILITLEVGQYLPKQRGLVGKKIVELGTAHDVELPWLTSLETPVTVLQLTGALVDRQGKAVRIGAEGIVAKRTPLLVSAIGAQTVLSDDDVALVLTARREDVAGQPLAWRVAMRELVRQLTP
jgi:hypothetical protein